MSILKIAHMGHPVLRQQARPLDPATVANPAGQKLIDDMVDTMHEYRGVGLAAPQVHEGLRLFVGLLADDPDEAAEVTVVINPEIQPVGDEREEDWEGCLSSPDIRGRVPRYTRVTMRAMDRTGQDVELTLKDCPARVAQHETDHLDGVLFFDRMSSFASLTYMEEYSRFWSKGEDE